MSIKKVSKHRKGRLLRYFSSFLILLSAAFFYSLWQNGTDLNIFPQLTGTNNFPNTPPSNQTSFFKRIIFPSPSFIPQKGTLTLKRDLLYKAKIIPKWQSYESEFGFKVQLPQKEDATKWNKSLEGCYFNFSGIYNIWLSPNRYLSVDDYIAKELSGFSGDYDSVRKITFAGLPAVEHLFGDSGSMYQGANIVILSGDVIFSLSTSTVKLDENTKQLVSNGGPDAIQNWNKFLSTFEITRDSSEVCWGEIDLPKSSRLNQKAEFDFFNRQISLLLPDFFQFDERFSNEHGFSAGIHYLGEDGEIVPNVIALQDFPIYENFATGLGDSLKEWIIWAHNNANIRRDRAPFPDVFYAYDEKTFKEYKRDKYTILFFNTYPHQGEINPQNTIYYALVKTDDKILSIYTKEEKYAKIMQEIVLSVSE